MLTTALTLFFAECSLERYMCAVMETLVNWD